VKAPTKAQLARAGRRDRIVAATRRLRPAAVHHGRRDPGGILWSALHGLAELSRHSRLRPDHETARVDMLISLLRRGHLARELQERAAELGQPG
jgi:hypothetical protein